MDHEAAMIHPRAEKVLRFWIGDATVDFLLSSAAAAHVSAGAAAASSAPPPPPPPRPPYPSDKEKMWWRGGGPEFDAQIVREFGADLEAFTTGERAKEWAPTPGGDSSGQSGAISALNALAGVIVCDQFSRNAFRGTPRAFALDATALAWAGLLLDGAAGDGGGEGKGPAARWPLAARMWCYLPFEHAERREAQARCVAGFEGEVARVAAALEAAKAGGGAAGGDAGGDGSSAQEEEQLNVELTAARGLLDYARAHQRVVDAYGRFPHRNAILGRESTPEELEGLAKGTIPKF